MCEHQDKPHVDHESPYLPYPGRGMRFPTRDFIKFGLVDYSSWIPRHLWHEEVRLTTFRWPHNAKTEEQNGKLEAPKGVIFLFSDFATHSDRSAHLAEVWASPEVEYLPPTQDVHTLANV